MRKLKKILLSIATIALVAAVAVKATGAFFTDSETNTGNTFTTGALTLQLSGTDSDNHTLSSPFFDVANMKPGETKTAYVEVKNTGNMGMFFRTYVDQVVDSGNLASQLKMTVTLNPSTYSKVLPGSLYGPQNTVITTDKVLNTFVGVANSLNNHSAEPMLGDYVAVYKVEVTLPADTSNTYQGRTYTANLHVDATQSDNNPTPTY